MEITVALSQSEFANFKSANEPFQKFIKLFFISRQVAIFLLEQLIILVLKDVCHVVEAIQLSLSSLSLLRLHLTGSFSDWHVYEVIPDMKIFSYTGNAAGWFYTKPSSVIEIELDLLNYEQKFPSSLLYSL